MTSTLLYLKQIEVGMMQNFVYLIGDPATHDALIVDPAWEVDRLLRLLHADDYQPTKIFLTHAHFDHINGVEEVLERFDIPVYAQRDELEHLPPAWRKTVTAVDAGAQIVVGNIPTTVVHTPGHTPGSQCLLVGDRLVTGDTLFVRTCGRTDLPGGDPAKLYETLTRTLSQMADGTIVCPGHNYGHVPTSTLGAERQENPFFQFARLDDFLRAVSPAGEGRSR